MAITVDRNGEANARVVNPKPQSDAWTVGFATRRRSRKSEEIERSCRLTLAYQYDPENAYVTLVGRAVINDDVAAKSLRKVAAVDRRAHCQDFPEHDGWRKLRRSPERQGLSCIGAAYFPEKGLSQPGDVA